MTDPYNIRMNEDRTLITCPKCGGMYYGYEDDPECSACQHDSNGSWIEEANE